MINLFFNRHYCWVQHPLQVMGMHLHNLNAMSPFLWKLFEGLENFPKDISRLTIMSESTIISFKFKFADQRRLTFT